MGAKNQKKTSLNTALTAFNEAVSTTQLQKDKLALKCLRDTFSESMNISSASSFSNDNITHTVKFSIKVGKFEETLAQVTICETIPALKNINPDALASVTIHKATMVMALELLGFDLPMLDNPVQQATPTKTTPKVLPETTLQQVATVQHPQATAPETTATAKTPATPDNVTTQEQSTLKTSSEVANVTLQQELKSTEVDIPQQKIDLTDSEDNNHSAQLKTIINKNKQNQGPSKPESGKNKKITVKSVAKLIILMKAVDLSQAAILSRLRNTPAKKLDEITMNESHRISNWLVSEKIDSSSIISKRKKFGGFDINDFTTPSHIAKPKKVTTVVAPDSAAKQITATENETLRAVTHYETLLTEHPQKAKKVASEILSELTASKISKNDVISTLKTSPPVILRAFRAKIAQALRD